MSAKIVRVFKISESALRRTLREGLKDEPALLAWYDDRSGDYGSWASNRVSSKMDDAVENYARPIAQEAMRLLRESKKQYTLEDRFAFAHKGFALMDSVQGTRHRVFSHEEWDNAVDTYFDAAKAIAANPVAMRSYLERGNVVYWYPAVPDGSAFRSIDHLFRAIDSESPSKYRDLLAPLRNDLNVIDLPFHREANPQDYMEEGRMLIASVLHLSIRKNKDRADEIELMFFPLVSTRNLATTTVDHGTHATKNVDGRWVLSPEQRGGGDKPLTFYGDYPITYRAPLTGDVAAVFNKRRLRPLLRQALTEAGYKELSKSPSTFSGPRAFYEDTMGRFSIRQPHGGGTGWPELTR